MTFSDDVLSSYLDGEAGPKLAKEIEMAMAADPALVARMERLGENDSVLREAFDEALGETPARLTAALEARPSAEILAFKPKPKPARTANFSGWPKMMAASVAALAVGAMFGVIAMPKPAALVATSRDGGLVAGGKLAAALGATPSGAQAKVGGETLTVALSFKDNAGQLCRQFRLGGTDGVACRGKDGWRIQGWMAGGGAGEASGYQTAGGPETSPITGVVDRLGVAQTLDRTAEAAAIRRGWR